MQRKREGNNNLNTIQKMISKKIKRNRKMSLMDQMRVFIQLMRMEKESEKQVEEK